MNISFVYVVGRFFYRIADFLRHWYIKSAYMYYDFVVNRLRKMDYVLAWRITAKNLFEPLYGDYSFIGHIMGFIFRSTRLLMASLIYIVVFMCAIVAYLVWLAIPIYLFVNIF
jgi:hypothetical protein